jgi:hypothetical protein
MRPAFLSTPPALPCAPRPLSHTSSPPPPPPSHPPPLLSTLLDAAAAYPHARRGANRVASARARWLWCSVWPRASEQPSNIARLRRGPLGRRPRSEECTLPTAGLGALLSGTFGPCCAAVLARARARSSCSSTQGATRSAGCRRSAPSTLLEALRSCSRRSHLQRAEVAFRSLLPPPPPFHLPPPVAAARPPSTLRS